MEALSFMLSHNIQPQRGFYVAFGHDEEVHLCILIIAFFTFYQLIVLG